MGRNVTADSAIAVGVMAYNEERNIAHLLSSLLTQTVDDRISRIVVVASGCTDRTCEIVRDFCQRDARVSLIAEEKRAGKIAAINTFLATASEPILVVSCGDLIFRPNTIEQLCQPLALPGVGMTGAHPMPINDPREFVGFAVNLMWDLHHLVAQRKPKMGELVAMRNVLNPLDTAALCDELSIESQIRDAGLTVIYASQARVHNQGPQTLREFFKQRCRWIAANYQVMSDYSLEVSTMRPGLVLAAAIKYVTERRPNFLWVAGVALIELLARLKAYSDYHVLHSRQKYRVWNPLETTKALVDEELKSA